MSLYRVVKPNDYIPQGCWIECFDQGCQRVMVTSKDNRMVVSKTLGILVPKETMRPFMLSMRKNGLDSMLDNGWQNR